jgi:hypothetical protein
MSEDWVPPEPEFIPQSGDETPNGHYVADPIGFDLGQLTPQSAPGEPFPQETPKPAKKSFREMLGFPAKKAKVKTPKPRKPTPPMPKSGIAQGIANMYTGLGLGIGMVDPHCGMVIVENSETCAQAWEELAKKNPKVRRALLMLLETSDVTKIVIAHAPIMMALATHHVPFVQTMVADTGTKFAEAFANQGHEDGEGEE